MVLAQGSDACFKDPQVQALIEQSKEIDECFASDQNKCLIEKMTVEEQREFNAQRLIPFDRSKNALFDQAVGVVTANFSVAGHRSSADATGQLISRCHVLTSAHLFYRETSERVSGVELPPKAESDHFNIRFHFGQTCDANLASHHTQGHILFRMTRDKQDFACRWGCDERHFYGKSDAVILKLKDYDKRNRQFFNVRSTPVSIPQVGSRVSCWGFPGYNNQIKLPKALSDQLLWYQLNAKIFPGSNARGILTNSIAYPGMSGGGCALATAPQELIGIYADSSSATGHAVIMAPAQTADARNLNFLTPLDHLAERYRAATGKRIEDLDKECD